MIRFISYAYDVNGIRTSKVRNGIEYKYIYDGNNLIAEQHIQGSNSEWIYYLYGVDGVAGFRYNETTYLYRKNVQGDVTHIYTESGEQVTHYAYDAWGNVQILQDRNEIATINPFRYRSYYFDEESKFYYLQTRYYDPALGRFISADSIEYLDPETLGGLNLYAYCGNNPVMGFDPDGTWDWNEFWRILGATVLVVGVALACGLLAVATGGLAGVVLMSVGIGVAFGAADGAYNAYKNGTDIVGGMFSGAIKGGATGLALGLGIVAGAAGLGIVWGFAAATFSVGANFLAGVAAYNIECKYNGREINPNDQLKSGLMQGASGLLSFFAGSIIGASGIYNVPGDYNSAGVIKNAYEKFLQARWLSNFIFGQIIKNLVNLPLTILDFLKKRKMR